MKRFKLRFIAFIATTLAVALVWAHFKGLPWGRVSPWAAFPADVPAVLEWPYFTTDSSAWLSEFAFTDVLQKESAVLRRALRIWSLQAPKKAACLAGIHATGYGRCSFSVVLDAPNAHAKLEQMLAHAEIKRVITSMYYGRQIHTVYFADKQSFALAAYRNLLIMAPLPLLVEEAIGRLEWRNSSLCRQQDFRRVLPYGAAATSKPAQRLYLQPAQLPRLLAGVATPEGMAALEQWKNHAIWLRLDQHEQGEVQRFTGAWLPGPSAGWADALAVRTPTPIDLYLPVIPDNVTWAGAGALSQWLPTVQQRFKKYIAPWAKREMALALGQAKGAGSESEWFLVLPVKDMAWAEQCLAELADKDGLLKDYAYQTFRVRQFMSENLLPIGPESNPFLVFLDNFAVFASSQAAIEVWIDCFVASKTLANDPQVLALQAAKLPTGSFWCYLPARRLEALVKSFVQPSSSLPEQMAHLLGGMVLQGYKRESLLQWEGYRTRQAAEPDGVTVAWKALLTAPAITPPYPVEDQSSRQTFIAVQDSAFRLFLLGPFGEVRWSKNLDGPVLSAIQRMDYYSDGSTAMLLNTAHNIYLLDLKGADVGNFPLPLQSPATNGVTVVNFDGGKQIGFFVACANGNLYGFDRLGRPLPGWNPLMNVGKVRFPLAHFYKEDKDYLVILNDKGLLRVHRRDGGERQPARSLEGVFLSPPYWQVSDKSNRIVAMNSAGTVHVVGLQQEYFRLACPVGAGKDARLAFVSAVGDERKDYAVVAAQELALYAYGEGNKFDRVFSRTADAPLTDVFGLQLPGAAADYIGALSRTAGKIYLYDATGNLYPGFPLAGHTRFFAADLYRNGRPIVVVAYGDSVYAYAL